MTEFISRMYGNEGYEIIIKTDSHDHYRATEEFARRLIDHSKPATNADKIRAMSDEKLALFVRDIISAESCPGIYCDCDECFFKEPCFNSSKWHGKEIEWLQQPAEEVDHEDRVG